MTQRYNIYFNLVTLPLWGVGGASLTQNKKAGQSRLFYYLSLI